MIRRTKNKTLKFAKDELKKLLVLDYRLLAERFRSDQFTSKQMTEEFKANPEFKDWYFKNYSRKMEKYMKNCSTREQ